MFRMSQGAESCRVRQSTHTNIQHPFFPFGYYIINRFKFAAAAHKQGAWIAIYLGEILEGTQIKSWFFNHPIEYFWTHITKQQFIDIVVSKPYVFFISASSSKIDRDTMNIMKREDYLSSKPVIKIIIICSLFNVVKE